MGDGWTPDVIVVVLLRFASAPAVRGSDRPMDWSITTGQDYSPGGRPGQQEFLLPFVSPHFGGLSEWSYCDWGFDRV